MQSRSKLLQDRALPASKFATKINLAGKANHAHRHKEMA